MITSTILLKNKVLWLIVFYQNKYVTQNTKEIEKNVKFVWKVRTQQTKFLEKEMCANEKS